MYVCCNEVVERCKEEGSPDGVYMYYPADMSNPHSAAELIQVYMCTIYI